MRELFDVQPDSLERFLTGWYGPPDRPAASDPAWKELPAPLGEWFELTSRWTAPITVQNQVLSEPWADGGKLVFWAENQGGWLWAADDSDEDPAVYDRESTGGAPWRPTGLPLSVFLLNVTVFEAVIGSRYGACTSGATRPQLDQILAPLRSLPRQDWRWPTPGHQLYAADGLLAFAGPAAAPGRGPEDAWEVWLAAIRPQRLEYLTAIEGVDWDAVDL